MGNVYVAERSRVRRIDGATGIISTYFDGASNQSTVDAIALDSIANLYIADGGNYRILKITPDGIQDVVAKSVGADTIAVDGDGTIYFAQSFVHSPFQPGIWKIDAAGIIQPVRLGSFYPASLNSTLDGLQSIFSPASRRDTARGEHETRSPRRWAKNVLD